MTAQVIDGKAVAAELRAEVTSAVSTLQTRHGFVPGLSVVLVGEDPASKIYVGSKNRQTAEAGMVSTQHTLDEATSQAELLDLIATLNEDPAVHGILVQLPLPAQIDSQAVIQTINPAKDVDGFHVVNAGRLATGLPALTPCTPLGCVILAKRFHGDLSGLEAVVVGRSNIVGKPLAQLLLRENCTVTVAHSRTHDLPEVCRRADLLFAAVGKAELIRGDWVKPGATVIDVGINRVAGDGGKSRVVGDVAYDEAADVAGAITPVPGGVGPMTIACLMRNTVEAACRLHGVSSPLA